MDTDSEEEEEEEGVFGKTQDNDEGNVKEKGWRLGISLQQITGINKMRS